MRGRPTILIALLACALVGLFGLRLYQNAGTGPFGLWMLRAGMPFATIDDEEHDVTKRRWVCTPLTETGRFCQIHGRTMTKGMFRLFVDVSGRAAVVQFWPDADNAHVAEEATRLGAEWTRVTPPVTAHPLGGSPWEKTSRWRTTDKRWSATIQYSCSSTIPTVIEVADDAALADLRAHNPDAEAQLAAVYLSAPPGDIDISDVPRRAPGECRDPIFMRPPT